MTIMDI